MSALGHGSIFHGIPDVFAFHINHTNACCHLRVHPLPQPRPHFPDPPQHAALQLVPGAVPRAVPLSTLYLRGEFVSGWEPRRSSLNHYGASLAVTAPPGSSCPSCASRAGSAPRSHGDQHKGQWWKWAIKGTHEVRAVHLLTLPETRRWSRELRAPRRWLGWERQCLTSVFWLDWEKHGYLSRAIGQQTYFTRLPAIRTVFFSSKP